MAKALWGGRFKKGIHPSLKDFSYSLSTDLELLDAEIAVDAAWAKMLAKAGLISRAESSKLVKALGKVHAEIKAALASEKVMLEWAEAYEDIHTLIQTLLEKNVGVLGKKIHTGRSRNDLVVTSTRLYLRERSASILEGITGLQKGLIMSARSAGEAVISGVTHLRRAQPLLISHHLLAYVEMLEEDKTRFQDCLKRMDVMPLGSAALAGSGIDVDQKFLAKELGFSRITTNSLASVSDRAFITEFAADLAVLWMHLSRLSEDFILWNSEPFNYIELDDSFSTGSSLMPQKKNPDVFELTRGKSGFIMGLLQGLLVMQKGLALSYNRDLQEDKPRLFDAIHETLQALRVVALTVSTVTYTAEGIERSVDDDALYATDLLDYLVHKGMPFSEAHEKVGGIVHFAIGAGKRIRNLSIEEFKQFSVLFDSGVYRIFDPAKSIRGKKTAGSTHPGRVEKELRRWESSLKIKSNRRPGSK